MKTYSLKPSEVKRQWLIVDASQLPLGRLSSFIAQKLTGKNKPSFTKHIDGGDYVIVINSQKLVVTGNKLDKKIYYRHTGYPGGIKDATLKEKMSKDPNSVIYSAVRGMLPVNKLRAERLKRLKIYTGSDHQHEAQKPIVIDLSKDSK